jgi:hypothetical protein
VNRLHLPQLRFGHDRERYQLEDWVVGNGRDFLASLGLRGGWWCAVNLPRHELFDEQSSGDVDLLAGPLGLRISPREFYLMVRDARRASPHGTSGMHVNAALFRAGANGLVQWPPDVGYTLAVEVKASHFDGEKWKSSHVAEKQKILGALRKRRALGVNDVIFVHLAVVVPTKDVDDMDRLFKLAGGSFPLVLEGADLNGAGYYRHLMAGMERDGQMVWGAQGGGWLSVPEESPFTPQGWHQTLQERLANLPRPDFFRTFVIRCQACGRWTHSSSGGWNGRLCECSLPQ